MTMILERAIKHLVEMLEDRGEDTSDIKASIEGMTDMNILYQQLFEEWKTEKTQIIVALNKTMFTTYVKNFVKDNTVDLVDKYERPHILFMVQDPPSSNVMTSITLKDKQMQHREGVPGLLQLFTLKQLQYNPSKHILVPKHEILSDAEVKNLLVDYQVKSRSHLPHIFKADAMSKWLGLKVGDVVRITRCNENSGTYYYHRCCV